MRMTIFNMLCFFFGVPFLLLQHGGVFISVSCTSFSLGSFRLAALVSEAWLVATVLAPH